MYSGDGDNDIGGNMSDNAYYESGLSQWQWNKERLVRYMKAIHRSLTCP